MMIATHHSYALSRRDVSKGFDDGLVPVQRILRSAHIAHDLPSHEADFMNDDKPLGSLKIW